MSHYFIVDEHPIHDIIDLLWAMPPDDMLLNTISRSWWKGFPVGRTVNIAHWKSNVSHKYSWIECCYEEQHPDLMYIRCHDAITKSHVQGPLQVLNDVVAFVYNWHSVYKAPYRATMVSRLAT